MCPCNSKILDFKAVRGKLKMLGEIYPGQIEGKTIAFERAEVKRGGP